MPEFAVIIPACLQVQDLLETFRSNLRTFRHDGIVRIIVVCNRLSLMDGQTLEAVLSADVPYPVQVLHEKERSVAGAWNRGIQVALESSINYFLITAVDVSVTTRTLEQLVAFGSNEPTCDVWSGTPTSILPNAKEGLRDACDFSCFMLRKRTIDQHGWFDKEYKPAYFEDNDYVTRVVLGGGTPKQILSARHVHAGSLTVRMDSEMSHHVKHWFGINAHRFGQKWGPRIDDYCQIAKLCHASPFNSNMPLRWWPEQDRPSYDVAGGIHE